MSLPTRYPQPAYVVRKPGEFGLLYLDVRRAGTAHPRYAWTYDLSQASRFRSFSQAHAAKIAYVRSLADDDHGKHRAIDGLECWRL